MQVDSKLFAKLCTVEQRAKQEFGNGIRRTQMALYLVLLEFTEGKAVTMQVPSGLRPQLQWGLYFMVKRNVEEVQNQTQNGFANTQLVRFLP